jgi:hypothetical protein
MKFLQVSSSLLTAVTLFTSIIAPAQAGMPDFSKLADPTAACKDIKVGDNTRIAKKASEETYKKHDMSDTKDSSDAKDTLDSSHKETEKTSGGGSFLGIGGNASHEESNEGTLKTDRSRKDDTSTKTEASLETTRKQDEMESTGTVVAGKDCDRVIESVAKVDMNKEDNATIRYNAEKKLEAEREKARAEMMKDMLKW